jgi:hypothetical protein
MGGFIDFILLLEKIDLLLDPHFLFQPAYTCG